VLSDVALGDRGRGILWQDNRHFFIFGSALNMLGPR
jgi:hypothetical protein